MNAICELFKDTLRTYMIDFQNGPEQYLLNLSLKITNRKQQCGHSKLYHRMFEEHSDCRLSLCHCLKFL